MSEAPWKVPASWCWTRMSEIATIVGGGTPSTTDPANFCEPGRGIAWITPADLSGYTAKLISRGSRDITLRGLEASAATVMPPGSVLFSSRAPIGYVAIAGGPVSTNQGFKSFVPYGDIEPSFLYYYLQRVRSLVAERAGGTTFKEISGARIATVPAVLAPTEEQRRVVDAIESYFSRLDDATTSLERAQAKLKAYRASVLKAAVEGRLVPTEAELARAENRDYERADARLRRILAERRRRWEETELVKLKSARRASRDKKWNAKYEEPSAPDWEGLPELPEGWCWASVQQLGFVKSGQTPSGVTEALAPAGEVPWFRVGDMNTPGNEKHMVFAKDFLSRELAAAFGLHVHPVGTIVFPKRGGAIATNKKRLLGRAAAYDLNTMGIVPVEEVATYLWIWMLGVDLGSLSDGSNVPQINHGDIAPLPVPLPPSAEQRRIIDEFERLVSASDAAVREVRRNAQRCTRLRQGILKSAFEGKLTDQDRKDEPAEKLLKRIRAERAARASNNGPRRRTSTAAS